MASLNRMTGNLLDPIGACRCCRPVDLDHAGGVIRRVEERPAAPGMQPLLMAPIMNAHDHVRGIKPISLGAFDLPLELWLTAMTNIPPVDPYLVAATALGRQVLGGVGGVMIHYTRPRDPARIADELKDVARAATDIGIRVAIAVSMRDRNPLGYGPDETILEGLEPADRQLVRDKLVPAMKSPDEQVRLVEELAAEIETPLVSVQFGPYGLEWCSPALLERIAARSADTGRRVHMHLLESPIQRDYVDHAYGGAPIGYLDGIGLLSSRLSVAHGVWLRPDEMELLAARGVTVCVNASSNLSLRSGIAPVVEMSRRGVPLALGLDGFSLDDDDDAFRELRLNYLLHKGTGLDDGLSPEDLLAAACYGGRWSIAGIPRGDGIAAGAPADLCVIDYAQMAHDIVMPADEARVLLHRGTARHLRDTIVAGRPVVSGGRLADFDLDGAAAELDRQVRHGAPAFRTWSEVSNRLGARLRALYGAGMHRCG